MSAKQFHFADLRVKPGAAVAEAALPKVSVVVLNLNGKHHLERCFESLNGLDYPKDKLDVHLIDNGSDDGSVEECRRRWPWVRLTVNPKNEGFSRACNQGARARGDAPVLAFLNNDMRVDGRWLRELVAPIVRKECAATTAKMFSWDGKHIDSAAGGVNFHGIGLQYGYKELPAPEHDMPRKTLFACGGAMAIEAKVFDDVGGFDPEFFAYYEDVDLGWRMCVLGHAIHYVPSAECWHHHSSTSKTLPPQTLRVLQVRNPLLSCFKNYDEENLRRVLPAALALALRRMLIVSGIPSDQPYRIELARPGAAPRPQSLYERLLYKLGLKTAPAHGYAPITNIAAADLIGINDLLSNWDHWTRRRAEVQSRRKRADAEIFRMFLRPMWCIEADPAYRELHAGIAKFTGIDKLFDGLTSIEKDPHP
jgi:GT2 family glycosyltransferase